jgi:hypothetical protein
VSHSRRNSHWRGLGVDHNESIGAAVLAGNVHRLWVGFAARPIALQLEQVLERGHRPRPRLHDAVHGHEFIRRAQVERQISPERGGRTCSGVQSPGGGLHDAGQPRILQA